MLRIWGRKNSINVQKVMWCVAELGLAHERIDVGGAFGGLETPDYAALNPNRRVPTIEDDGFVLWESNAIVRYLAHKHGLGTLWPTDLEDEARAGQWMDWTIATVMPPMTPLFWNLIRYAPEKRDPAAVAEGLAGCRAVFALLDAHLADRAFVLGQAFTMGDIPLGTAVYRWYAMPVEQGETPHLAAYYRRLQDRPAFREHVMIPLS